MLNSQSNEQPFDCTVVIPTADRGLLLGECLASVFNQTKKSLHVIVVDNGVREAVVPEKYTELLTLIRTAPRIGPGRARNIGALAASTEYIAFLDDDDYWEANYLEKVFEKCSEVGAGVVVAQLKRRVLSGDTVKPYKLMPEAGRDQRGIYFSNPGFGGQNIILRREVFLGIGGFDENMPASVDRDLAARLLQKGEVIYVQPEAVAVLRDHEGDRVRGSQIKGNYLFIKKHWRKMSAREISRATLTLARRFLRHKITRKKIN